MDDIVAECHISSRQGFCETGFQCIMPIENLRIMIPNGRSIWQKHAGKQQLMNAWKSLNIVVGIIVITRIQPAYLMLHTARSITERNMMLTEKNACQINVGIHKTNSEVDELERLRHENIRPRRQRRKDMVIELKNGV